MNNSQRLSWAETVINIDPGNDNIGMAAKIVLAELNRLRARIEGAETLTCHFPLDGAIYVEYSLISLFANMERGETRRFKLVEVTE